MSRNDVDCLALVFGNAAYREFPLPDSEAAACDVTAFMTQAGYAATQVLDADKRALQSAFRTSCGMAATNGSSHLVVYFAGHGVCCNGENYLVPVDGIIDSDAGVWVCFVPCCSGSILGDVAVSPGYTSRC
jgi:uncharacterized caspase-like protein